MNPLAKRIKEIIRDCHIADTHCVCTVCTARIAGIEEGARLALEQVEKEPIGELCQCGHSKDCHGLHKLDNHGADCNQCYCKIYTWASFVFMEKIKALMAELDDSPQVAKEERQTTPLVKADTHSPGDIISSEITHKQPQDTLCRDCGKPKDKHFQKYSKDGNCTLYCAYYRKGKKFKPSEGQVKG